MQMQTGVCNFMASKYILKIYKIHTTFAIVSYMAESLTSDCSYENNLNVLWHFI